jgi:hypothetical protein
MANQENDKTFFGNAAMHKGKFGEFFRLGWNEDDLKTMLEIARDNDGWCNAFLKEGKSGKWYMEAADSGRDNDRSDRGRDKDRGRDRDDSRGRDDRDRDERPSSRFGRSRDDRDEPRDSGADRSRGTGRFGNKAY